MKMTIWRENYCYVLVLFILNVLLGIYGDSFEAINKTMCAYDGAGVLRIMNTNPEEARQCMERYNHTTMLYYTQSGLKEIPSSINILKYLDVLDLSENDLSEVDFNVLDGMLCSSLSSVNLDNNNITVLRKGDLDCLTGLRVFNIVNNSLTVIENGTFTYKLSVLEHIDLAYNKLSELDLSLLTQVKLSHQKNVHQFINASWNNINIFTNSFNVTINDFTPSTSIALVLVHNNFTRIDAKYLFKLLNVTNDLQLWNLMHCGFDLRFNPLICDCATIGLAKLLREFYTMDRDNPVFSLTCGSPEILNGKLIRLVNLNDFNCSVPEECPLGCDCILTINIDLISVRCGNDYTHNVLPLSCPKATTLLINMKTDNLQRLSPRSYMRNVTSLDVSDCSVTTIEPAMVRQLNEIQTVYLHDNKLEYIPNSFKSLKFSKGQIMSLYGNQFVCDCHTLWIKKWLISNNKNIIHEDKTLCASGPGQNNPIVNVPDYQFICPFPVYGIVAIATGSSLIIVIVSAVVIRNRTLIQICLISNFDVCKYCCRKRTTNDFTYDIFVSHSCEDDDDVTIIVESLEHHSPPYKVCLGERDFSVGKTITENILNSIKSSHTTLIIISNNFLRSSWCDMEFREAHTKFLKDRDINLILVVLEDLDKTLINTELKDYMDSHVYINYRDKRFYARLLLNLPVIVTKEDSEKSPLIPKTPER